MTHLPALDGLRGIAILAVLAYHSGILSGGFVGVDLFFALSGFLITRLLIAERDRHGDVRLGRFWIRRALRLAPALVAALLLAVPVSRFIEMPLEPTWIAATLLYASNLLIGWGHVYPIGLVSHTWSLAMEEQFYLLWPPLVLIAMRTGRHRVCLAAGVLAVAPCVLRLVWVATHANDPALWLRVYFAPEMRFDAIALGCLGGAWTTMPLAKDPRFDGAIAGAALVGAGWLGWIAVRCEIGTLVAAPMLFSLTSLAATTVVLAAVRIERFARPLAWKPLVLLGRISYGLYLVHVIVFVALDRRPIALRWAVALAIAVASWWLVERPFLRLKRRFERGSGPDAESEVAR